MSSLNELIRDPFVKSYYSDLTEEEIERRLQMYLEIFPFIVLDFGLLEEGTAEAKKSSYRDIAKKLRDKLDEVVLNGE